MNFGQALEALKKGKKIQREGWGGYYYGLESYQTLMDKEASVMIVAHKNNGGLEPAQPSQVDLLAEDWRVIQ